MMAVVAYSAQIPGCDAFIILCADLRMAALRPAVDPRANRMIRPQRRRAAHASMVHIFSSSEVIRVTHSVVIEDSRSRMSPLARAAGSIAAPLALE